jgi:hypothetical protein
VGTLLTLAEDEESTVGPVPVGSVLETELSPREESLPEAEFVADDPLPDVEQTANGMPSSAFRNRL